MNIIREIKHRKDIVITADRLRELQELTLKYCETIKYKGKTFGGMCIEFKSVDELLNYDNFKSRRLKSLEVYGYDKNNNSVRYNFEVDRLSWLTAYSTTCTISYTVGSDDMQELLLQDITTFLEKVTTKYWIISKLSVLRIVVIAYIVYGFAHSVLYFAGDHSNTFANMTLSLMYILVILSVLALTIVYGLIWFVDYKIIQYLFPPLTFNWGEEINTVSCNNTIRNVLISIVVGLAASVVAGLIVNILN